MASNPPGACCTVGVKHEGTPTGKLQTIDGSLSSLPQTPLPPGVTPNPSFD